MLSHTMSGVPPYPVPLEERPRTWWYGVERGCTRPVPSSFLLRFFQSRRVGECPAPSVNGGACRARGGVKARCPFRLASSQTHEITRCPTDSVTQRSCRIYYTSIRARRSNSVSTVEDASMLGPHESVGGFVEPT